MIILYPQIDGYILLREYRVTKAAGIYVYAPFVEHVWIEINIRR